MRNLLPPVLKSAILVAVAALCFGNAGEMVAALIAAIDQGDSAALQRVLESKPDLGKGVSGKGGRVIF
ncbi:MAG TPA: hypothetical protein VK980_18110 [Sphingomonas sp.]|nr:hypothetical protein [Sphingomonas sp.]